MVKMRLPCLKTSYGDTTHDNMWKMTCPYVRNYKRIFSEKCELGKIDRRNMNRRLNLDIPQMIKMRLPCLNNLTLNFPAGQI
jgi:hypothetical protein